MSANQIPSPYGTRRLQDVADRGIPTRRLRPIEHPNPLGSMSVAAAPGRTLPPPFQSPVAQTEAAHRHLDRTGRQLSSPQRGQYTTQQRSATQLQAASLLTTPYQYQPAIHPTPGLTSLPHTAPFAYNRNNVNETNLRPANEHPSSYGVSTQSTYRRDNVHSLGRAPSIGPDNASLRISSGLERNSIASLNARESTYYQYTQPAAVVNPLQYGAQDFKDRYQLRVRQQPCAARACGFGERDRRVVDPPPIVQLSLRDYDPSSPSDVSELKSQFVVHCTLRSVPSPLSLCHGGQDVTAIPEPNNAGKVIRKLTGTLVASPFVAIDPDTAASLDQNSRLGCFFLFSDLSCRQIGRYKLNFTIIKVAFQNMTPGSAIPILSTVESDEFEVYSAKDFPGMKASTPLTIDLRRQGALVSVKKGIDARRGSSSKGSSISDALGDAESRAKYAASTNTDKKETK